MAEAKGKGFPLKITATEIRVEQASEEEIGDAQIAFVKNMMTRLEWPALVQACGQMGIPTLPQVLTEDMAHDTAFFQALYNILMNVHLVQGMLTCPVTGREFPVTDGIPNMMIEEEECENFKF